MQGVTNIHQNSLCSSVVIDDLYSRFHTDPNIGIACLYADYKDQNNQTLVHILGCFLHQFLTAVQNPIPDEVIEKLDDIRKRGGKAGSEDMLALLKIRLQQFKLGFICIDAVDELDPHVQRQVLDTLKELGTTTNNTRLFLTGRSHMDSEVQKRLQAMQQYKIVIRASPQDIQDFLRQQIRDDLDPDIMDEALEEDIINSIINQSQGMYVTEFISYDGGNVTY